MLFKLNRKKILENWNIRYRLIGLTIYLQLKLQENANVYIAVMKLVSYWVKLSKRIASLTSIGSLTFNDWIKIRKKKPSLTYEVFFLQCLLPTNQRESPKKALYYLINEVLFSNVLNCMLYSTHNKISVTAVGFVNFSNPCTTPMQLSELMTYCKHYKI